MTEKTTENPYAPPPWVAADAEGEQNPSERVRDAELMGRPVDDTAAPVTEASVESGAPVESEASVESDGPTPPAVDDVLEGLRDVVDPELGINVVDLGLIYGVDIDDDATVVIDMTLTTAACPLTDMIEDQTDMALEGLAKEVRINWVWMPPWTPARITEDGRDQLRSLGFNV